MSSYTTEYVTRRVVSDRPGSSYTTYSAPTRQYVALDSPGRNLSSRKEETSYSKSYSSTNSGGPGGARSHTETTSRSSSSNGGPGQMYSSSSEYRSNNGPGSHFSSCTYKSPYGNNYRTFSTR